MKPPLYEFHWESVLSTPWPTRTVQLYFSYKPGIGLTLDRFVYFALLETEWVLYKKTYKVYNFTSTVPIPEKTKNSIKQLFPAVRFVDLVVRSFSFFSLLKMSFKRLLWQNIFYIPTGFKQKLRFQNFTFNLDIYFSGVNYCEVRRVTHSYDVINQAIK